MDISRIGIHKVGNIYDKNSKQINKQKSEKVKGKKDLIEISSVGKKLSTFASDEKKEVSAQKLERIRKEIAEGTYNVDSKLVAKKMIDIMKGRDV